MTKRGPASASRAAFVVLTVLLLLLDVASARLSRRRLGNAVKQGPLLPVSVFVFVVKRLVGKWKASTPESANPVHGKSSLDYMLHAAFSRVRAVVAW